jgi:hypothetical protein
MMKTEEEVFNELRSIMKVIDSRKLTSGTLFTLLNQRAQALYWVLGKSKETCLIPNEKAMELLDCLY